MSDKTTIEQRIRSKRTVIPEKTVGIAFIDRPRYPTYLEGEHGVFHEVNWSLHLKYHP